jgi:CysZ protein
MHVKPSLSGLEYLIAGFRMIFQPGLRRFVVIPLLINLLFFIALFFTLKHFIFELNTWLSGFLPTWLHWLSGIIWVLFFIAFTIMLLYTFVLLANIIAAPFNSLLAEKVELYLTGKLPPQKSMFENMKDIPRVVWRQILIILYFLPRALLLGILFFIPVINLLAPFIWFAFSAWFMTMQYLDFPADNHRVPLHDLRASMSARKWPSLQLGAAILVAMMIPGLNLIAMPAAVAAATKFWLDPITV